VHEEECTRLEINNEIQNIYIEESKGNIIVGKREVLKIWQNYII